VIRPATENKMLTPEALENKATAAAPVKSRYPTGELDAAVFARVIDGETHGRVPLLDVRQWRRSPVEVGEDAFRPTAFGVTVQAQFAPVLLEAIAKAAGLEGTVAGTRIAA
jgi:hypothetical protein